VKRREIRNAMIFHSIIEMPDVVLENIRALSRVCHVLASILHL
jgi:hypothetical protein